MTTFKVENMHCDACARRVEKAVEKAQPGSRVTVDVKAGRVTVERAADPGRIAASISAAGYPATVAS
jgi:copper chaperone CopZ